LFIFVYLVKSKKGIKSNFEDFIMTIIKRVLIMMVLILTMMTDE